MIYRALVIREQCYSWLRHNFYKICLIVFLYPYAILCLRRVFWCCIDANWHHSITLAANEEKFKKQERRKKNRKEYQVEDNILRYFLFFDFLLEKPLIIDIQIVISITYRTDYKFWKKKNKQLSKDILTFMKAPVFTSRQNFRALFNIYDWFAKKTSKGNIVVNFLNILDLSDYLLNFWWEKSLVIHMFGLRWWPLHNAGLN